MADILYDRVNDYASVKINLASPNDIRSWSFGEVKKPETINYRTYRPEKDGLFCERIFGPERDYECACGKYKGTKFKGIICDRCGVKVTHSRVRRKRMGHINLAAPIVHIWFFKAIPSHLGNLLGMKTSDLEKVIYFQDYVVTDPGDTPLEERQLLTEDEYRKAVEDYGTGFVAEETRETFPTQNVRPLTIDFENIVMPVTEDKSCCTCDYRQLIAGSRHTEQPVASLVNIVTGVLAQGPGRRCTFEAALADTPLGFNCLSIPLLLLTQEFAAPIRILDAEQHIEQRLENANLHEIVRGIDQYRHTDAAVRQKAEDRTEAVTLAGMIDDRLSAVLVQIPTEAIGRKVNSVRTITDHTGELGFGIFAANRRMWRMHLLHCS